MVANIQREGRCPYAGRTDYFLFDQASDFLQQGFGFTRPCTRQHEQAFIFTDNRFVLTVVQVA